MFIIGTLLIVGKLLCRQERIGRRAVHQTFTYQQVRGKLIKNLTISMLICRTKPAHATYLAESPNTREG
ncbi:hypothetical protein [Spirosoma pulveris]